MEPSHTTSLPPVPDTWCLFNAGVAAVLGISVNDDFLAVEIVGESDRSASADFKAIEAALDDAFLEHGTRTDRRSVIVGDKARIRWTTAMRRTAARRQMTAMDVWNALRVRHISLKEIIDGPALAAAIEAFAPDELADAGCRGLIRT